MLKSYSWTKRVGKGNCRGELCSFWSVLPPYFLTQHWLSPPTTSNATWTHLGDSGKSRALQLWGVEERYHQRRTCSTASSLLGQHLWIGSVKQRPGAQFPPIPCGPWVMALKELSGSRAESGAWRSEQGIPMWVSAHCRVGELGKEKDV